MTKLTRQQRGYIRWLYLNRAVTQAQLARRYGVGGTTIWRAINQEPEVVPPPEKSRRPDGPPPSYIPSPDQIRQACLEIQSQWSEAVERSRRGLPDDQREKFSVPDFRVIFSSGRIHFQPDD